MGDTVSIRRSTFADFTRTNPILLTAQWGWENDTRRSKIGDGITPYNDLPYVGLTGNYTLFRAGENLSGSTIHAGQVVAVSGSGFVPAVATSLGSLASGLALDTFAPTFAGTVQTAGLVSQSDWTLVSGSALLTPNATYYLSATAGHISTTAPTTPSQVVQVVGIAQSTIILDIRIGESILL